MDSQHTLSNPWSSQSQEHDDAEDDNKVHRRDFSSELRFRRDSSDHRHYSYASSTTIAPEESFGYADDYLSLEGSALVTVTNNHPTTATKTITTMTTTTPTTTLQLSDYDDNHQLFDSPLHSSRSIFLPDTDSTALTIADDRGDHAPRALSDSGVGLEGDVLGHLVQKLQSEVADTRAIVFDLESRLNVAENSNKHIVDELKMLLVDAEGTLVGSDESDSGESVAASSKLSGSGGSDEDSNVVYNRICNALQSLISEAQSALVHTTTLGSGNATSSAPSVSTERNGPCRHHQHKLLQAAAPSGQRQLLLSDAPDTTTSSSSSSALTQNLFPADDVESNQADYCNHSSCRTSRRSSIALLRTDKPLSITSGHIPSASSAATSAATTTSTSVTTSTIANPSRVQAHSRRSAFSRMLWKEKQLEQYERYRRSCDRVSLELEMLLNDTIMDQQDLWVEYSTSSMSPAIPAIATTDTAGAAARSLHHSGDSSAALSNSTVPASLLESSEQQRAMSASPEDMTRAARKRAGMVSEVERLQRSYQVQLLGPQVRARQLQKHREQPYQQARQHRYRQDRSDAPQHLPSQRFSSSASSPSRNGHHRQFRSQGVGSSRPQTLLMQLYSLWKQTWLRRRIMHVLTESLEIVLILWVVVKLSETSLAWMGYQMTKGSSASLMVASAGNQTAIGAGAATAKELYKRIRRDGLRIKQVGNLRRKETARSAKEFIEESLATEVAMMGTPRRPFTSTAMVWAPTGNLLAQAVSGVVLAFLVDQARQLVKKL
ncbi:hypothetical protein BGZ99_008179 [Dissophora globulifera]|uniref:Uncharacterized protein n=1 Tax=Dissophora globulifera TaxID=979702 RepID=A0A9P6RS89_9FUNG|nr:hypothetical protein BGZ99_008179 [Dissophora globulifera]